MHDSSLPGVSHPGNEITKLTPDKAKAKPFTSRLARIPTEMKERTPLKLAGFGTPDEQCDPQLLALRRWSRSLARDLMKAAGVARRRQ